jgi:hypothetical protein
MASIIKVDTIQDQDGNNIINENANTVTIGKAGDSVNVTPGAIKDSSGNVIISKSGTTVTLGASGDTVSVASGAEFVGGGITWQSDIKTSAFTAVAGEGYWINTTSAAVTMTLPASASVGDTIEFTDYARTWNTNNLTINQNGLNYQGSTSTNPIYDVDGQSVRIVYSGATKGWIPTSDDDVTDEATPPVPLEYLVVAGGGAGGNASNRAGGGGAGGLLTNYGGTAIELSQGETYTVTVGAGGAGSATGGVDGQSGSDSVLSGTGISTVTAIGGGGGASNNTGGLDGGSGGGGYQASAGGSGTVGQGNDGGTGWDPNPAGGGGGGGAGAVGGDAAGTGGAGDGGVGLQNSITGSATYYAGGGGGTVENSSYSVGSGGTGGGAAGTHSGTGGSGTANTGGGGGSGWSAGGSGGSGVVFLRVATADYTGTTTGSPTVTTDGTDTIMKFTASGSYTA